MRSASCLTFGDVLCPVRRHKRRRTLALVLAPDGGMRVLAPAKLSLEKIDKFLHQNARLIRDRLRLLRSSGTLAPEEKYKDGGCVFYQGQACLLRVTRHEGLPCSCVPHDGMITINVPDRHLSPVVLADEVRLELLLWYKKMARRDFEKRLKHWSSRLGAVYGRMKVTSPERRWGSCSARNDIRLNWRLIMAPAALIDYVVAHELCHVIHKNHSRAFWQCLGAVMPDYQERRRQLRAWEKAGGSGLRPFSD